MMRIWIPAVTILGLLVAPGAVGGPPGASRIVVQRDRPVKVLAPDAQAYVRKLHNEAIRQQALTAVPAKPPQRAGQRRVERAAPPVVAVVARSNAPSLLQDATPRAAPLVRAEDVEAMRSVLRDQREKTAKQKRLLPQP